MIKVAFPNAVIVVDHFHLQRHVLAALKKARTDAATNNPEHKQLLAQIRPLITKHPDSLTPQQRIGVERALAIDNDLEFAYWLADEFRRVMNPNHTHSQMACRLSRWYKCADHHQHFRKCVRSFKTWHQEILNYATTNGATNAFAEGITNSIKVIKRNAYGYRNWQSYRATIKYRLGESINPHTGELLQTRTIPPGQGTHLTQPSFA